MDFFNFDFLDERITHVMNNLEKTNSEYTMAHKKCYEIYENLQCIFKSKRDIEICAEDCDALEELLELEATKGAILEKNLYIQGYLDCVRLFKTLGVIN